jgi:hypothetical protein
MPFTTELTIHPHDLQKILDELSVHSWSQGPVIIRDLGTHYIVRDVNLNHILTIEQTEHERTG